MGLAQVTQGQAGSFWGSLLPAVEDKVKASHMDGNRGSSEHHMGSGNGMPGHMGSSYVNPWQVGLGGLGHGVRSGENQGHSTITSRQRGNDRFSGWARGMLGQSARNQLL